MVVINWRLHGFYIHFHAIQRCFAVFNWEMAQSGIKHLDFAFMKKVQPDEVLKGCAIKRIYLNYQIVCANEFLMSFLRLQTCLTLSSATLSVRIGACLESWKNTDHRNQHQSVQQKG